MKLDRAHLSAPHQVGHIARAERIGRRAVGANHVGAANPVRPLVGDTFLEEALGLDALGEPVQVNGTAAVTPQANFPQRCPMLGKISLGDAHLRPEHPVGAGDSNGSIVRLHLGRFGRHCPSLPWPCAERLTIGWLVFTAFST